MAQVRNGFFALLGCTFAMLVLTASASASTSQSVQVMSSLDNSTNCTFRDAVTSVTTDVQTGGCTLVDLSGGDDKVTFAPALAGATIHLTGGAISLDDVMHDIQILGPGMNQLTVSGDDNSRVFTLSGGRGALVQGLSVVHGKAPVVNSDAKGGAIDTLGGLTLTDVKVADSAATASDDGTNVNASASGGGIHEGGGSLTLNQSVVSGNTATATQTGTGGVNARARGGGIFNEQPLTLNGSTVSGNQATATSSEDALDATAGIDGFDEVDLSASTISGNIATATAGTPGFTANATGGLFVLNGNSTVEQSTIAANTSDAQADAGTTRMAGGVNSEVDLGIRSSTIALNGPTSLTGIDGANLWSQGNQTLLMNSIIADPRGGGDNCVATSGSIDTDGWNDDYSPNTTSPTPCFATPGTGDMTSNPLLSPAGLQSNGGPTQTIALQPTSPVIDAGNNGTLADPTHDQRGLTRPVDFPGIPNALNGTDIGSVEVQQACPNFIQSTPSTPCPPPPPSGGGGGSAPPATTAGPTGQRAAALAKCKKKKSKAKRRKCKKQANLLPV